MKSKTMESDVAGLVNAYDELVILTLTEAYRALTGVMERLSENDRLRCSDVIARWEEKVLIIENAIGLDVMAAELDVKFNDDGAD